MQLGERIRTRRKELQLSLRELAQQIDLTPSFLSRIERGQSSPSIDSLRKISEALDVPVFYFLVEANPQSPVVQRDQRRKLILPELGLTYQLLTPDLNRKMEVAIAELEPRDGSIATPLRHATEECIYILQGQLEIGLAEEVYLLNPGDSIYFEGPRLRHLMAKGEETLRFVFIITPPIF